MKKTIFLLGALLALLCFGCPSPENSNDPGNSTILNVSETSLVFTYAGGSQLVAVSGNAEWTAVSNQVWCSVSPGLGYGNSAINFTVQLNNTVTIRTAKITVKSADNSISREIVITQAAGQPAGPVTDPYGNSIDLNPTTLDFTANAGNKTVQITSNVAWQIITDQAWCSVSASSGNNDSIVTVSVSANENYTVRTATLTLKNSEFSLTKTIAVTQAGVDPSSVIIYASYSGNDSNNGKSWSTAVKNITTAIQIAPAGGNVWVEEGTYQETVVMKNGVNVYGGFNRTESGIGDRGTRRSTILNNTFAMAQNFTTPTIVDGFMITGSNQTSLYTNVTMNNCEFKAHLYISGGTISNSVLSISLYGDMVRIYYGGKIINSYITINPSSSDYNHCIIIAGGRLEGCIISGSLYGIHDMFIYYSNNYDGRSNDIVNCTFHKLTNKNSGRGDFLICSLISASLNFVNNIVLPHSMPLKSASATNVYYANNIMELATTAAYFLNEDLSPMSYSTAVNAGDSSFVTVDKDILGNPRIRGGKVDTGAIESPY